MKKDLISLNEYRREDIEALLDDAAMIEKIGPERFGHLLKGKILMVLFLEPSTRTRLSFETAMYRLGGNVIGFSGTETSSLTKGESLYDTVRTVEQYADILVMRDSKEGSARFAAEACSIPVINGGDGANQHPTQTLLDIFTIRKHFHRLNDLSIALVGDLKYSRTVHSLLPALSTFGGNSYFLVSPESLRLPEKFRTTGDHSRSQWYETTDLHEVLDRCDILYMTRIQRERFPHLLEYEKVKDAYRLEASMLENVRPGFKILHPLPRVREIAHDVDRTNYAAYFDQVHNGVIARQAVLLDLLEVSL